MTIGEVIGTEEFQEEFYKYDINQLKKNQE